MKMVVTLRLEPADAEPILRNHAERAAFYSALLDYTTRRTGGCPNVGSGRTYDQARAMWQQKFLQYKRVVESFGVEPDHISEQEALRTAFPFLPAGARHPTERRKVGPTEGVLDLSKPYPHWCGGITQHACEHAADRTVRAWRARMEG